MSKIGRKRASDVVEASEREFRLIINSIPAMILVFSGAGKLLFANHQVLEYFGATEEELMGWEHGGFTHPDDIDCSRAAFASSMTAGKWVSHELRARRFDGTYRWFESRGHAFRDVGGSIVRWSNMLTDIDDRKRIEKELRLSNQYLTIAQELSQTGSYTWEPATDSQTESDQWYRIWEVNPAEKVTYDLVVSRVHPDDRPGFVEHLNSALKAERDMTLAYRILTDTGAVKHFRTISRRTIDGAGRVVYVGATQDVTEIKLVEETAHRARADLAHVTRVSALNTLTASIAHELNQPLAGIVTNASTCLRMLEADRPNLEGVQATAQRTIRDARRATEIIQRLRSMFAHKHPNMVPLDLNDAARQVLALCSDEMHRRCVAVRTEFDEHLPLAHGDRVQLQQVILNLVLNAADAMSSMPDDARTLVVGTRCDDSNRICLFVRDSGMGIEPQFAEKIFDAFFTTKTDGMGIGLSVSRSIIETHEGRIWAAPNDERGATFTFSIPCKPGLASTL